MSIDPELLKILACPVCKTPVRPDEAEQALYCESCHRLYPIRDEIPVMLVEQARVREKAD